jgi:hypothetical protein
VYGVSLVPGNQYLEFCLWVLEVDGLTVGPFDQHSDGNGELRALGMTPDLWRNWLERTHRARQEDLTRRADRFRQKALRDTPVPEFLPHEMWPGSTAVQEVLRARWTEYDAMWPRRSEGWRKFERLFSKTLIGLPLLKRRRPPSGLPSNPLFNFVDYPGPTLYVISSNTVIIGARGWEPHPSEFRDVLWEGIWLAADAT